MEQPSVVVIGIASARFTREARYTMKLALMITAAILAIIALGAIEAFIAMMCCYSS